MSNFVSKQYEVSQVQVLITVPNLNQKGGVTEYFKIMTKYMSVQRVLFQFGREEKSKGMLKKLLLTLSESTYFEKIVSSPEIDLVHINPSLNYGAVFRDALFLLRAKKYGKKVLIFFHGWNEMFDSFIDKCFRNLFHAVYKNADAFVVLATEFRNRLRNWGFKQPIFVESTPVDDILLKNYSQKKRLESISKKRNFQILFLSRIEREKGILEVLKATRMLLQRCPNIRLMVAGSGSYLIQARRMAREYGLLNRVEFLGFVRGEDKIKVFVESDVYLFPTYHGEGMPTSVLEAMAFGLPIITRPIGGIKDFFEHGQHGFLTDSKQPEVFAHLVERIFKNKELWKKMSMFNHDYANRYFVASSVVTRIEDIYCKVVESAAEDYANEERIVPTVWWCK